MPDAKHYLGQGNAEALRLGPYRNCSSHSAVHVSGAARRLQPGFQDPGFPQPPPQLIRELFVIELRSSFECNDYQIHRLKEVAALFPKKLAHSALESISPRGALIHLLRHSHTKPALFSLPGGGGFYGPRLAHSKKQVVSSNLSSA